MAERETAVPKVPRRSKEPRDPQRRSGMAEDAAERVARLDRLPSLDYAEAVRIRVALADLARRGLHGGYVPPILLYGAADNGRTTVARVAARMSRVWAGGPAVMVTLQRGHGVDDTHVSSTIRRVSPRVVIVDGCDALAEARGRDRRRALAHLHAMAADGIIVVAVCNGPLVSQALSDVERVGFVERLLLPRWTVGPDYHALLRDLEGQIGLREPSHLDHGELALRLHELSDGRLGVLTRTVRAAAAAAIQSGTERITPELLDALGFGATAGVARPHR